MNFGGSAKESKIALWEKYERDIDYLGEKPLSYSTFCHYTNMYNTKQMTYRERHGYKAFASTFLSYIPSEKLRYGNSLWCADGSGTLAYSYLDKEGKLRSMRLYIIIGRGDRQNRRGLLHRSGNTRKPPKWYARRS